MGVLVARGRMQTESRELRERAKLWNAAIKAEFVGSVPSDPPELPNDPLSNKLF